MCKAVLAKAITFEEVKHRLENKELENYSKQDVFERYIVYGSEEELNNHTIQRLLIKIQVLQTGSAHFLQLNQLMFPELFFHMILLQHMYLVHLLRNYRE